MEIVKKRCLSLLVACITFISIVNGQKPSDTIDVRNIKSDYLESLFMVKLNEHRLSLKKSVLKSDTTLRKAAKIQAVYCYGVKKLTHQQVQPEKRNVEDRVVLLGGLFGQVGENLLYTFIKRPFTNKSGGKTIFTYAELVEDMYQSWKNSPGHYANMINGEYSFAGMGFQFDSLTKQIYAAQVFGSKPFIPLENGLDYAFKSYGIKPVNEQKCVYPEIVQHLPPILSNYLYKNDDSIMLFIGSLERFNQLFGAQNDGIAIDIVFKEQFKCGEANNLHPSPIYDGYMLRPVFSPYLKMVNRLAEKKVYNGKIGILPKSIRDSADFQLSTLFIKDSNMCVYSYPVMVEAEPIDRLNIQPHWMLLEGTIGADTIRESAEIYIPFERNQVTLSNQHTVKEMLSLELNEWVNYIDSVQIYAYSSIEGEEEKNLALQNKRAEETGKFFKEKKIPYKALVKENWEVFYQQLQEKLIDYDTIGKSKDDIRNYINQYKDEPPFIELLNAQREGKVIIYFSMEINDSSDNPELEIALERAIQAKNAEQVNIISSRIVTNCLKHDKTPTVLADIDIPQEVAFLPALNNQAAAKLLASAEEQVWEEAENMYFDFNFYTDALAFLDTVYPHFKDCKPLKFNYILAQLAYSLSNEDYDVKKFRSFENEINLLAKDQQFNQKDISSMYYNYYLAGAMLYYYKYLYSDMDASITKLKPYLHLNNLSREEVFAIGRFFNIFNMHNETIELLETYLEVYPEDEDLIYLYCNTGAIYNLNQEYNIPFYLTQIDKLIKKNKARYCAWINENFQLLREDLIKPTFCKYCTLK